MRSKKPFLPSAFGEYTRAFPPLRGRIYEFVVPKTHKSPPLRFGKPLV